MSEWKNPEGKPLSELVYYGEECLVAEHNVQINALHATIAVLTEEGIRSARTQTERTRRNLAYIRDISNLSEEVTHLQNKNETLVTKLEELKSQYQRIKAEFHAVMYGKEQLVDQTGTDPQTIVNIAPLSKTGVSLITVADVEAASQNGTTPLQEMHRRLGNPQLKREEKE